MIIAYIAHPISGDIAGNLRKIKDIVRDINLNDASTVPFAPYYLDCIALDDNNPVERLKGIANDTALLQAGFIHELWLYGEKISAGMMAEIELAHREGIKVVPKTDATADAYAHLLKNRQ